ncbi:UDP-glucuronosyltransferase 2B13-like [Lineus longissimus]|uniref:UDP-glucuronosyltransferase 2B13-like n=1 Tax=Lineus longissimus TaxID=88925 RepID=UPI00315D1782
MDVGMCFRSFLLLGIVVAGNVSGSKILLVSPLIPSHIFTMTHIGKELLSRGHDVWMLLPNSANPPPLVKNSGIRFIQYRLNNSLDPFESMFHQDNVQSYVESSTFSRVLYLKDKAKYQCHSILENYEMFEKLRKINFDFILLDDYAFTLCLYVIPHKLGVKYGSVSAIIWPYASKISLLPSIAPARHHHMTNEMGFWERLLNTILKIFGDIMVYHFIDSNEYNQYIQERPYKSLTHLASQTSFWLIDQDILLDYPVPLMPNMIYVGGLSTEPHKRLPDEMRYFAGNATNGLVVVSFGSTISNIPDEKMILFLEAFRQLNQSIIWKYRFRRETAGYSIPSNVLIRDWIPQNDILGHPNTQLFITHCGNSGQFEALYGGVPMIGFPLTAEQPYNARRLQHKNYGITLNIKSFTAEELVQSVKEVLGNQIYSRNIKTASKIFRFQGSPRERAAKMIERVIEFGSGHLSSPELSVQQLLLYDIVVFLCICLCVAQYVIRKTFKYGLPYIFAALKSKRD